MCSLLLGRGRRCRQRPGLRRGWQGHPWGLCSRVTGPPPLLPWGLRPPPQTPEHTHTHSAGGGQRRRLSLSSRSLSQTLKDRPTRQRPSPCQAGPRNSCSPPWQSPPRPFPRQGPPHAWWEIIPQLPRPPPPHHPPRGWGAGAAERSLGWVPGGVSLPPLPPAGTRVKLSSPPLVGLSDSVRHAGKTVFALRAGEGGAAVRLSLLLPNVLE